MKKSQLKRIILEVIDDSINIIIENTIKKMDNEIKKLVLSHVNKIINEKIGKPKLLKESSKNDVSSTINDIIEEENLDVDRKIFDKEGGFWDALNETAKNHVPGSMNESSQLVPMFGGELDLNTSNVDVPGLNKTSKKNIQIPTTNPDGTAINLNRVDANTIKNLTKDYSKILKLANEKAKTHRGAFSHR